VVRETRPVVAGTKRRGRRGLFARSQEHSPAEGRNNLWLRSRIPHGGRLV